MNKSIKTSILAIATCLNCQSPCFAGASEVDISLKELAEDADIVAIVTRAKPFEIVDSRSGCDKMMWQLKVKTVLKQGSQNLHGTVVKVHHNVLGFDDCTARQAGKSVYWRVIVYQPSNPATIKKDREFIIFLKSYGIEFELYAINAFESISKRQILTKILRQQSRSETRSSDSN